VKLGKERGGAEETEVSNISFSVLFFLNITQWSGVERPSKSILCYVNNSEAADGTPKLSHSSWAMQAKFLACDAELVGCWMLDVGIR